MSGRSSYVSLTVVAVAFAGLVSCGEGDDDSDLCRQARVEYDLGRIGRATVESVCD